MSPSCSNPIVSAVRAQLPESARVLVALSGGADSVALLAAMVEAGMSVTAVHCNYHLRGDESNRDEQHARSVASRLGVELIVIDCDVDAFRDANPNTSVEMACRSLRYDAFRRLCDEHRIDYIAVGHHREDNRETMLLNLFRGSGLKGVGGMSPLRGNVVRPLLYNTRDQIVAYLKERGLDFVTDSSNLSCDYRRNAIRNAILPAVRGYFPSVDAGLDVSLEAFSAQRRLLYALLEHARHEYVSADGAIDLTLLVSREECPRELLFELLNYPDYVGYTMSTVDAILRSADKSGLTFKASDEVGVRLERGRLIPLKEHIGFEPIMFDGFTSESRPGCFEVKRLSLAEFKPERGRPDVAYFDEDKLQTAAPLTLRAPLTGDRMTPYGMKGSRLLSDIFSDAKLPHDARAVHPVIVDSAGRVIWLPGLRASAHYAVTPSTRRILRVTYRTAT
ncbi:MAG: tRNA lysidine(34) synthetase TilS [Muribaculaceae bacterium]|nr:tRNA lysidine(34) synthetase TilS [Muribaculaceae bacterium]